MSRLARSAAIAVIAAIVAGGLTLLARPAEPAALDAAGFVEAANGVGAGLVLGEPLPSREAGTSIHALGFTDAAQSSELGSGADLARGAASLVVSPDADGAAQQYARCDGAVTIRCYRAENVTLLVDSPTPAEIMRLDRAFDALGSR